VEGTWTHPGLGVFLLKVFVLPCVRRRSKRRGRGHGGERRQAGPLSGGCQRLTLFAPHAQSEGDTVSGASDLKRLAVN